ncbi:DNA-directed RNA polymerase subunit beta [bacterium CG17_big_fil_post_rev_8_21_14_2_50_64_8]|nr:MAG: DNA-directed RNA polymerase subunit beta [bacterium CG17_big_fil_post_rev_8_21_14_2_50_64_8]PJA73249.1 MAG: DNA-directed RNA polymerase subunit beta [bacterium CG_4_9_14_3_um_filter_65_15]
MPNLLAIQLDSYHDFLQSGVEPDKRQDLGIEAVFRTIFPIESTRGNLVMEYMSFKTSEPKYGIEECGDRGLTFSVPLKVKLRLVVKEAAEGSEEMIIRDIQEQEVYLGELPMITDKGTFLINGAERVIVSQLHRSPGVFFSDEIHPNGRRLFRSRIIPYRGSWVEFTTDINNILYVHIDRKRKQPATILLRALGFQTNEEIIALFHTVETVKVPKPGSKKFSALEEELEGRILAADVYRAEEDEPLARAGAIIDALLRESLLSSGVKELKLVAADEVSLNEPSLILNTLRKDPTTNQDEGLRRLYSLLRPGDPPNEEVARALFERLFFNEKRYDLAEVGRYKMNRRLKLDVNPKTTTLTPSDFLAIIHEMIGLFLGRSEIDDIDHFGNRRIRSVGELLANQFSVGLSRMARIIKERMNLADKEKPLSPADLVNARTVSAVIQSFFGSSQLSQFMDQTNPLSELTHKRRLSALGPGGLHRDRAGFEVRDVHYTHYGRMCPIETPEGPNIGLIASLATHARINSFGFIESPYRRVDKGVVSSITDYLTADQEDSVTIAQANAPLDDKGKFREPRVLTRFRGEYPMAKPVEIDYMDVSPKQIVSAAASLIPFLEHDDANRALMGCNMQRQAVPLLRNQSPVVGTGMEKKVAIDSGAVVVAEGNGVVESATADAIVIRYDDPDKVKQNSFFDQGGTVEYTLRKFRRSNQDTCYNQRPLVMPGDRVKMDMPIADGPCTQDGELALGRNLLVAFMPWGGYNYEDAILIGEKAVKDDNFTSLHIEEFELQVRDTKRGVEEVTREIPNVGEEALRNLDDEGVIFTGAHVKAGDIMVGKVTPKGETELSPEEKLLRAIFGEKAGDVKDASLKAPPGMDGIVVDVKVFSRQDRTTRSRKEEKRQLDALRRRRDRDMRKVNELAAERLSELFTDQLAHHVIDANTGEVLFKSGRKFTKSVLAELDFNAIHWGLPLVKDDKQDARIRSVFEAAARERDRIEVTYEKNCERALRGDELPPGVVKLVKVHVARRRKLSVGDKMAGRHGNKGVVSKIMADEDMPYLDDGTPVDIVLNPLGVPSRMNLGQILETHLGYAAFTAGSKIMTPVFDGATITEIKEALEEQGLDPSGKSVLFDGRTGERFDKEVTVGIIYVMKLHHLVEEKIHARSIGPYSLVTQQPLGGKAQFGGQRFGEMEVWALEAYGAANCLQEMLTVKSDDVTGRSRIYEAIVKGENPPEPGIPESFNVLMRELQSLCLDVNLESAG